MIYYHKNYYKIVIAPAKRDGTSYLTRAFTIKVVYVMIYHVFANGKIPIWKQ